MWDEEREPRVLLGAPLHLQVLTNGAWLGRAHKTLCVLLMMARQRIL
jgi:hypothetical protein